MTDMYRSATRVDKPSCTPTILPPKGNLEFTACPQLLRDGGVGIVVIKIIIILTNISRPIRSTNFQGPIIINEFN
jgi:hypothetical protein